MIKRMPNIVLLGAPGCGKGTLAKHLVKEMGYVHFSTGDMFREIIQTPTELGKKIKAIMDSGSLISDDITNEMIKTYIEKALKENKHFILDGYPRNISQAKILEEILKELNQDLGVVIYLDIDKKLALNRALGRITCPKCGASFNEIIENSKPKNIGICDYCNSTLVKRSDDNEESFLNRFDTYLNKTKELIDYYNDLGVLRTIKIDDNSTPKSDYKKIKEILEND